jgi:peptidyl-prolyl cis-trans isomerase C
MPSPWRRSVLLGALVVLGCAGARRDEAGSGTRSQAPAAVAHVAGRPILLSYYEDRLSKMDRRFLPDTLDLDGKRKFLDFIINKELMAKKAEDLNLAADSILAAGLGLYTETLLANGAIDNLTQGKLEVTEKDLQDYLDRRMIRTRVKHILVRTRREADALRQQLLAGADFDSLAAKHSLTTNPEDMPLRRPELDVQIGESAIVIDEAVIGVPVGSISEPVWTAFGWHLFKPVSTSETKRMTLDGDNRRNYETQIQMRRKRRIVEDYHEGILSKHGFRLDEDALNMVYDRLPPDVQPEERPNPATEVKPVIPFTAAERQTTLYELDGKAVTVGDFSDAYDATSWFERPKRATGAHGIRMWIRDRWLKPLQLAEARATGVDTLSAVAGEMAMRREQMMVAALHARLISSKAPEPTEAEMVAFYDKYKSAYVDPEKRRCNVLFNQQEKLVRRAYDEILAGADFVETAVRYVEGASEPQHVRTPFFTRDNPDFREVAPLAFSLLVGQYGEPIRGTQGWAVIQLDSVMPEKPYTLEQVRDNVKQDFKTLWGEQRLNDLLAEWRRETPIEIHDDVLKRAEVRRTDVFVPGRTPPGTDGKASSGDAP